MKRRGAEWKRYDELELRMKRIDDCLKSLPRAAVEVVTHKAPHLLDVLLRHNFHPRRLPDSHPNRKTPRLAILVPSTRHRRFVEQPVLLYRLMRLPLLHLLLRLPGGSIPTIPSGLESPAQVLILRLLLALPWLNSSSNTLRAVLSSCEKRSLASRVDVQTHDTHLRLQTLHMQ